MADDGHCSDDLHLFCRNLRLLDLDRLDDWPPVSVETFRPLKDTQAKLKSRVRITEWVLYRLCELWDRKETHSKLGDLFPALEPLQSVKLRTGILQFLSTLKQDGILAKECVLRKSMLDDCRGEKVEQLLLSFSTAVLKRIVTQHRPVPSSSVNNALFAEPFIRINDSTQEGLRLAMDTHARRIISDKNNMRLRLSLLLQDLNVKQHNLVARDSQVMQVLEAHLTQLIEGDVDVEDLKAHLRDSITGNRDWLNTFISGDHTEQHSVFWDLSFHEIWGKACRGHLIDSQAKVSDGLLTNLNNRVAEQQNRLNQWRDFQRELSRRSERSIINKSPLKSASKIDTPRFSSRSPKKAGTRERGTPLPRQKLDFDKPIAAALQQGVDGPSPTDGVEDAFQHLSLSTSSTADNTPTAMRHISTSSITSDLNQLQRQRLPQSGQASELPHAVEIVEQRRAPGSPAGSGEIQESLGVMPPPTRPLHARSNLSSSPISQTLPQHRPLPSQDHMPQNQSVVAESPSLGLAERTRQSLALANTPSHRRHKSVPVSTITDRSASAAGLEMKETSATEQLTTSPEVPMTLTERAAQSMARLQLSTNQRTQPKSTPRPASSRQTSHQPSAFTDHFTPSGSISSHADMDVSMNDVIPSERPETPPNQVTMDAMDAESIFKPRSRLRRSPPPC